METWLESPTVSKYWHLWSPVYIQMAVKLPKTRDDTDALLEDLHHTSQQYGGHQRHHQANVGTSSTSSYHTTTFGGYNDTNNYTHPPGGYEHHEVQESGPHYVNYNNNRTSYESSNSDGYATVDNMNQPIYEPQNIKRSTVTTVTRTTQQRHYDSPPRSQSDFHALSRDGNEMAGPRSTSLRSNLSELDNMLEDLNSAQFLDEVDKRSQAYSPYANVAGHDARPAPPPLGPRPSGGGPLTSQSNTSLTHVDRMLHDLEQESDRNLRNAQQQGHHYEHVRTSTSTTSHTSQHGGGGDTAAITSTGTSGEMGSRAQYVQPSNATRELDDLMASLSEFNMNPMTAQQGQQQFATSPGFPVNHAQNGPLTATPPMGAPPSKPPMVESPYAVANKGNKYQIQQQMRTVTTTTTTNRMEAPASPSSLRHANRSPLDSPKQRHSPASDRDRESMTRFDTPVRNLVPEVQVQSSSYANVEVDGAARRGAYGSESERAEQQQHYYQQQQNAGRNPDRLDAMLGQLDTDMQRHGVTTVAKGHCAACNKPIIGQVITALGKIWHPEHFCCAHCNNELGTMTFFERDGRPYCEDDYHSLFSPRCAGCNGPILDRCVTGLGMTWHPEHFCCAHCGRPFDDEGFHEKEGKPYCREDYFEMFAPKCGGCRQPIVDNYISALNKQWHPECFICQDCHMPFSGGSFYDHDGMPFCETHYHAKRGSLCAGCQKPITGRCITAMYKKFHPEHFVCAFCLKQLNKGTFKEQNDKPYCHSCFVKLFG